MGQSAAIKMMNMIDNGENEEDDNGEKEIIVDIM